MDSPRSVFYRFNFTISNFIPRDGDEIWSCLAVLVTFWFFARNWGRIARRTNCSCSDGTEKGPLEKGSIINFSSTSLTEPLDSEELLVLKNKAPRWHEQLQCWCLNFRGRVTVASVKNFQLVAAVEPHQISQKLSRKR